MRVKVWNVRMPENHHVGRVLTQRLDQRGFDRMRRAEIVHNADAERAECAEHHLAVGREPPESVHISARGDHRRNRLQFKQRILRIHVTGMQNVLHAVKQRGNLRMNIAVRI